MRLKRIQTSSRELEQLQGNVQDALDRLTASPMADALVLERVSLTTGVNKVNHRLGRKLRGWSVARQRSAASIYDAQDACRSPELLLELVASADVVVDLVVY